MFELGQLLKKARLENNISLDELQETTKIRKRYLEAIEEGNYKILPGNFYVRAFIKSYAEAVGLDPNELLRMYRNVIPASAAESQPEPIGRSRSAPKLNVKWGKWVTGVMLWCFLLLVVGILYYVISKNNSGSRHPDAGSVPDKRITNKAETPAPSVSANASVAPSATPSSTPTPSPTPSPSVNLVKTENGYDFYAITGASYTVDLTIVGEASWVRLDRLSPAGKREPVEKGHTLENGQTRSWNLNQVTYLQLGRANAVELKVNGVPIAVGDSPNVKWFQFDILPAASSQAQSQ